MKRIIKNEFQEYKKFNSKNVEIGEIPGNSQKIHPITLNWIDNTKSVNPICLTKPSIEKEGITLYKEYRCINKNSNYKSYLYTPPIGITSNDLLKIYDVDSIEKLQLYINDNIDNQNIFTINRIVNSWIRVNFDTIKIYNNFLEKIYKKMLEKYLNSDNYKKYITSLNLDKEIKDFIDYWFDKNNIIGFNFDLLIELEIYLGKIKK